MRLQMRDGSRKGSVIAGIRMPFIQSAGVLSYILLLVMRIPLSRNIGDAGMGLFAPAFEIFLLVTFLTSYSMAGAMTGVIRYRVKREQHKNARRVFGAVFTMDVLFSIVVAAGLVLASAKIADILVLEPASRMAILAAAPTIVFAAIIGTFRGYFSGYGLGTLSAHSQYIEKTAMIFCTLACSGTFYKYGNKVAALVQRKEYSFAYGALGAMVGVMLSQVITVIYLLAVYVLFSGATRGKAKEDNSKRAETRFSIQRNVLLSCLPTAIVAIFTNLFMLVDQRMFNYCMNRRVEELGEIRTAMWGAFYSKFAVLTGVAAAICLLSASSMTGRIKNAYDREEYRIMRERMGRAVGRLSMVAFPVAIYLAALAEAVVKCAVDTEGRGGDRAVRLRLFLCTASFEAAYALGAFDLGAGLPGCSSADGLSVRAEGTAWRGRRYLCDDRLFRGLCRPEFCVSEQESEISAKLAERGGFSGGGSRWTAGPVPPCGWR